MEAKWDGFRLLVAIDNHGCIHAWSRRGTSLGDRLGSLLEPLAEAPSGTVFDAELVALSSRDGRAVQDFAAVCRATLQADAGAARKLHLVAFDLLELAALIGHQIQLAYSRIDADGSLREVRIRAVDA